MMPFKKNYILPTLTFSISLLLYGCSSTPVDVVGKSSASPVLKQQIIKKIESLLNLETGCSSISGVKVSDSRLIRYKNKALRAATEVWKVSACGIEVNYPVKMGKDSKGESYFEIGPSF